jgi:hypothetical protein
MSFIKRQLMGEEREVSFIHEGHRYVTKDGKELISVSKFIEGFKTPFDSDGSILRKSAEKKGLTPEALQKEWDKAKEDGCNYGTSVHSSLEHFLETGKVKNDENKDKIKNFKKKIKFEGDIYSEQLLFSVEDGIAGTTDMVELFDDNSINIYDLKTNKKLEKFSVFKKRMLPPISKYYDVSFTKYEFQLSIYAYLLELQGFWIRDLTIFHSKRNSDDIDIHPVRYLRSDVITMIEWYKNGMQPPLNPTKKPYSPWI